MFEVSVEHTFSAAHALRDYRGKCERVHGHNYRVRVTVEGAELAPNGLLIDFVDLRRLLHEAIEPLDHRVLNDLPPFDSINPTAEEMARYFYHTLAERLKASHVSRVRLKEVQV
ncbi:MAG: 6-carboxytetrahydropterin synthase QueD, partial [Thermoleophilia bacterium]|nr:6-carboxytetrahydropterin synthase QueD [Thermoleophilia bacterium]